MGWNQATSPSPASIGADLAGAAAAAQAAAIAASQPVDADLSTLAANGPPGTTGLALLGCATPGAVAVAMGADYTSPHQTILKSTLTADSSGNASTSGVLHAVYIGYTLRPTTVAHVRCFMTAAMGSANQIGEFALFSSPLAPIEGGQTLTCLAVAADAGITTWTVGAGVKTNTAAFTVEIPAGVHLWAGMRTACTGGTGTQPTWRRCFPLGDGQALWLNAAGVIALAGAYVCVPAAIGTQPPNLYASLGW